MKLEFDQKSALYFLKKRRHFKLFSPCYHFFLNRPFKLFSSYYHIILQYFLFNHMKSYQNSQQVFKLKFHITLFI